MPMQTGPGASFEVVEPQLLLELLMRLLANRACLEGGGERLQCALRHQVGEIVLVLPCGPALAHQPDQRRGFVFGLGSEIYWAASATRVVTSASLRASSMVCCSCARMSSFCAAMTVRQPLNVAKPSMFFWTRS